MNQQIGVDEGGGQGAGLNQELASREEAGGGAQWEEVRVGRG